MKHTFKLSIDCANAAFCEDDTFDTFRNMHDMNGNIVGTFALKTERN
jgi:hypothetical protein